MPAGFEGGQLPLMQRIPKLKGFKNPFRVEYTPVNLAALEALGADEVTVEVLVEAGLARPKALVKVLGQGSLSRPVRVSAHAFSKSAEAAITAAGGSVERVALPFAQRPPASGNALMNR
jgi:large subunit ribosomal protein L15